MSSITIYSSAGMQASRALTAAERDALVADIFAAPVTALAPIKVPTANGLISLGRSWVQSSLIIIDMTNPAPVPAPAV